MKLFFALFLFCVNVRAQIIDSLPTTQSETSMPGFSWEKFKARSKLNYFNFATGPSIKKMDDNEISDFGTKNPEPVNMYHTFIYRFNLKHNLDYFMQSRFDTPMGDLGQLHPNQDHNRVWMDDWDFGLYYTFINKTNFSYAQSAVYRSAWSNKSRGEQVDNFYVWQQLVNWAISPRLRLLHWTIFTYYDFNNKSTIERYRLLPRTLLNITLSEHWLIQLGYELDMQHANPYRSSDPHHRDAGYFKRYHSYSTIGIGWSPVHTWTILPYIRSLDERNIRNETTVLGFMVMGKII